MALIEKIGRIARLLGIVGASLGSFVLSACNGKTSLDGKSDPTVEAEDTSGEEAAGDVAADDAARDPGADPQAEEAKHDDAGEEEPDTDLWEVICE